MKFLNKLFGAGRNRKISTRILVPLVLAFMVFGMVGFINSGQNTAHAASSCGSVVRDSEAIISYFGDNLGTVQLIKNTCTGLFYGQVICSLSGSLRLSLASVQVPYHSYNEVDTTCTKAGQIVVTAPHVYVQSQDFFAAVADLITLDDSNGGSGVAVTTQP